MATVERLAREALTELNHLLGALRREPTADRAPAPTLAELETLMDSARASGVPAGLTVEGPPRALTPGVELSCYRIIAEALTNVARHAPGAPTRVVLRYRPGALDIEVANGPAPGGRRLAAARPASGGRGVRGMREPAGAAVKVIVLTTYDLDEYVYEALRAGACGFLLKHAPPEELLLGVRAAADGGALLSPGVTSRLLAEFATGRPTPLREPAELV